jgi:hypothetical protein
MSPEEYRQSVSTGFHEASTLIGQVLAGVGVLLAGGIVLWLLYVRQGSLADLANRMLAALPSVPWGRVAGAGSSLARATLGSAVALSAAAALLAFGSIPAAVILESLAPQPRTSRPATLRDRMLTPEQARKLLARLRAGADVAVPKGRRPLGSRVE